MDSLTDRTIALLRADHDDLAGLVASLTEDQLTGGSGADEWSVAQVLSHLGSGAEITGAALAAAVTGTDTRGEGFNQGVWDRWNALAPAAQASGSVESNERLVAALEALTPEQRTEVRVALGFLPEPVGLATFLGTRLNEFVQHSWDVRVAVDPDAGLSTTGAALLAEHLSGDLGFFLGFIGKADALASPATVQVDGTPYAIVVADGVRLVSRSADEGSATATFAGPLEAAMRLLTGRLGPARTPAGTTVTGNVTLDDLRRVFPGF